MSLKKRFSDTDLQRIKVAVQIAESKVSGEIVPVFVESSSTYPIANLRGAGLLGGLTFLSIIIASRFSESLIVNSPLPIFFIVLLGAIAGLIISEHFIVVKRLLVGQSQMDLFTRHRAERAFLEEEVFNTRQRTGIMILVSFFEREVIVLADKGISNVLHQNEWDSVVKQLTNKIKYGDVVNGMIETIERCTEILLKYNFVKTSEDENELKDDLRFKI